MIYKYRDRDFTGINGHMFAHKGISKGGTPFYVEDLSGQANTITIEKRFTEEAPTVTVEKSTDGVNWTSMGASSTTGISAAIPANGKLYLRCSTDFWAFTGEQEPQYNHISVSDHCSIGGNIMSLLYGAQFTGNETVFPSGHQQGGEAFRRLFNGCDTIIRADALVLPVIELTESCYAEMFEGCASLTAAPELPATKLANYCYYSMFEGCTALSEVKCLATDMSASGCLYNWLSGVARSGTFYKKDGVVYKDGVSGIPKGWTTKYV